MTGAAGGVFEKMFYHFMWRRENFLKHYHQRSNVESTFSAIKRKFGDSVRSKPDTAMTNEVLAKLVCNSLTDVIQQWYELGIDPADWGMPAAKKADAAEQADVLPMVRPG